MVTTSQTADAHLCVGEGAVKVSGIVFIQGIGPKEGERVGEDNIESGTVSQQCPVCLVCASENINITNLMTMIVKTMLI